nr:uncharacterized protein LOC123757464 isoform X2 [Procambarus clarkii]
MRLMGVITYTAHMNPTGNVTYTHKKFKRAPIEACDTVEKQQLHHEESGKKVKSEASTKLAKSERVTVEVTPSPLNGFLSSPTSNNFSGNTGQLSLESDDGKKRNTGNSGGKYKCEYCGLGCAKPSVLDKHIRTHTNERPYSCDQCSVAFKTKSNYLKHTRSRAHALRCDGGIQEGSDGTVESSDNLEVEGDEGSRCPSRESGQQCQPADLSVAEVSIADRQPDFTGTSAASRVHPEEFGKDRGSFIYKPKFRVRGQYSLQEDSIPMGHSPPIQRQQSTPPQDVTTFDCNTIIPSTYQIHAASNLNHPNPHSSPSSVSKQCLPPLDIRAANRKDEGAVSGQRNSVVTSQTVSSLWKGMKSPSPELVGQHITKLIVENQAIVETHNPLWSRRYKRQSSLGSSSSESDGSGSGKSRRYSITDSNIKNSKSSASGPLPVVSGPVQSHPRERSHSLTAEAIMVESRSSYSPSLPPTPHLHLAQPTVNPISASKPSISSQGPTTSYSQSAPTFTASHVTMVDFGIIDASRKRCISEGPSIVRDLSKSRAIPDDPLHRQHPQNPEGSVIKNLLLTARDGIVNAIDQNLERQDRQRMSNQVVPVGDIGSHLCSQCRISFRNTDELDYHLRHHCGQRPGAGSERGTPDSIKSGDGSRWPGEQDVALDLQKKHEYMDQLDRERSSSRGSSVGEASHRRGSEEDSKYHRELSPKVYRSKSTTDAAPPPTKKRKMSDIDNTIQERSMFLSPIFSSKGQGGSKNESCIKIMEDINKQKFNNCQLFGGEVQICDGNEFKTIRIDTSQPPSPAIDICIPPQQLGANISKSDVSVPTSVVVTIAKSGLNSGGTMVQVENQISTSSTKTVPSLVSSSLNREKSVLSQSLPKAAHSPNVYNTDSGQFPFSSPFLQYAPPLQIPNLAIPGIPTPDLGGLSFSAYTPRVSGQTFLHGQTSLMHGILGNHKQNTVRSPIVSSRVSPGNFSTTVSMSGVSSGSSGIMHGGASEASVGDNTSGLHAFLAKDKEKEHVKMQSKLPSTGYPALIPVGDEKVPYVPGIPGPYSQGSVLQPPPHSIQRSPLISLTPPISAPVPLSAPVSSVPSLPALISTARERNLTVPKSKEISREHAKSPVREQSQSLTGGVKIPHRLSPRMSSVIGKAPELRAVNPEIRIHPPQVEPVPQEKKTSDRFMFPHEDSNYESCSKDESSDSEEFLPPLKRPNFLPLKPQPFMPKSSLALIGTTLVSPDTPRPKKSCVQMLLNGSAYTYLGHKVSTKSYFCCIYRQQPMYVPQSTDPKLSMYSNWQIRKPAEDNPFKLTPYQGMGLYESRKHDHAYTIAKPKELNLIQTHSSYWTFKEEKEKNKGKEDKSKDKDSKDIKIEELNSNICDQNASDGSSSVSVKRESDDESVGSPCKVTDEAEGSDSGSAKRIKIFEGGFKSSEDYTYVRGRGRGRYVCETCGIRCKKPSMLKKHIRTHTDLRPYACGHCTFSFKTKGNLTKHLRSKAHYKRCVEMGIVPVPTVVDESHVNEEALALQVKMEQEGRLGNLDGDDDEDDDDDDDEGDEDDDDDEDESVGDNPFESAHCLQNYQRESSSQEIDDRKGDAKEVIKDCHHESSVAVSRSGVLVMQSTSRSSTDALTFAHGTKDGKLQKTTTSVESPIDLSVKRTPVVNFSPVLDKTSSAKKSPIPRRPSFLPLLSKPSVTDMRSPANSLASPGTPSTPIREHASEILSPVTESSSLLKSIYNTTERASHVSFEKKNIVPDPTKENGCSSSMLQAYLKECAVLDTTIKRQQYKDSSTDTSPDSPHGSLTTLSVSNGSSTIAENAETTHKQESTKNCKKSDKDSQKEGKEEDSCGGASDEKSSRCTASPSSIGSVTSTALQSTTSRMPTPPANLTVMNSGGIDTKTAFLVPSGIVPSSLNRLGNDDGKCKCSICHKEFNRQAQLSIHMNIHYMERPYRCESCAVSFRTNGHLQKHKRSVSHFNKVNMNMTFGTPSTNNPRPYKCHDCKIAFRIHGHLAKHLRSKMHIMKLECLGKLPFGTYAEIERSGANLNEIDTTDCDNSLESLQAMASRLYKKDPSKFAAWQNQQERHHHRERTVSNSSTNSDDYPLQDEQDDALAGCGNDDDTEGDEDEDIPVPGETGGLGFTGAMLGAGHGELHASHTRAISSPIEIGSGATAGLLACHLCHEKFLDLEHLGGHLYNVHKVSVTYRNS